MQPGEKNTLFTHSINFFPKVTKVNLFTGKKYGTFGCVPQKCHLKYKTSTNKNIPSQKYNVQKKIQSVNKKYDPQSTTMVEGIISSLARALPEWDANVELLKLSGEKKNPAQKYNPPENKFSAHNKITTSTTYAHTKKKYYP